MSGFCAYRSGCGCLRYICACAQPISASWSTRQTLYRHQRWADIQLPYKFVQAGIAVCPKTQRSLEDLETSGQVRQRPSEATSAKGTSTAADYFSAFTSTYTYSISGAGTDFRVTASTTKTAPRRKSIPQERTENGGQSFPAPIGPCVA